MNKYIERVLAETKAKNAQEPEFLQTVEEVLSSLEPVSYTHLLPTRGTTKKARGAGP